MTADQPTWRDLSDDELLKLRVRQLSLRLEDTDVAAKAARLADELEAAGLEFRPLLYLGDEWFSPEGVPAIAIPFFLAHPKLRALEKKMILECEGEDDEEFMRLLRHECGHAFDHAFKVSKRRSWMKIFGSPKQDYHPESYHPRPYSKNFVRNIDRWYAQAHPDEDFAETFAVWLDPKSQWKQKYRTWSALKKLEYVDKVCKEFANERVNPYRGRLMFDARTLNSTLETFYRKRRKEYEENYPHFYDHDLLRIFSTRSKDLKPVEKASVFMRRNKKAMINSIAYWTSEKKVTVTQLVNRLTKRCQDLDLVLVKDSDTSLLEISGFLTTLVSNYLFTGHFKRTV